MAGNKARAGVAGYHHGSRTRSLRGAFDRDCVPACPAVHVRGRGGRMEELGATGLSASHACRRRADREQLSRRTITTQVRRDLRCPGGARGWPEGSARDQEQEWRERRGMAHYPRWSHQARAAADRVSRTNRSSRTPITRRPTAVHRSIGN